MPKIKTRRAAFKRFKKTASGKIKRHKAYGSHILTKKTRKRKRRLRQASIMESTEARRVEQMLPYL